MLGFIYKDFEVMIRRSMKSLLLLGAMALFLFGTTFSVAAINRSEENGAMLVLFMGAMVYYLLYMLISMFIIEIFEGDKNSHWNDFAVSTPGAMREQIKARYAIIGLCYIFVLSLLIMVDTVTALIFGSADCSCATIIFVLFCYFILKEALVSPFIFKFGANNGIKIKTTFLTVIMILLIIYFMYGDISLFIEGDFFENLKKFMSGDGTIWLVAILPYAAGLLYWVSCVITLKICRWRSGSYE